MTTKDKLKIITDNIRQKLPRLMELEEGCLIKDKGTDIIGKIVHKDDDEFIFIQWMDDMYVKHSKCSLEYLKNRFKSLGKEPMLTDMLEWLSLLKEVSLCYLDNNSLLVIEKSGKFYYQVIDITKPYLKDQSKEVIDFLYNFIENEKTP
ncbi:hypothetical protein OKE68_08925 [Riemerella anatipestifer]|uniref:Uncharacterized protein n=1 Tax=Riemerella anatipestifer TaxID=34085 RepID=A0AAP3AMG6_RIEAN|nr:hypothetical protein [Riemerella anatipestifer]MBT0572488.1 hypothetical protein [Riemerella anatipestifer]MCU7568744.1 hypothetical protein [Riemerella anatipestifer]MCW0524435.1 hypothetical protein [Riemerella anatipestifer]MDR7797385.1 hypothetical protein [Riemerella anatipestifer]MDY3433804.1 hypothetical protein [Riemerella anatipestifer]